MLFMLHQSRGTSSAASSAARPSPPGLVWQPACFTAPPQNARLLFGGGKKSKISKQTENPPEDNLRTVGGREQNGYFVPFFHPCLYESRHSFIKGSDSQKPSV